MPEPGVRMPETDVRMPEPGVRVPEPGLRAPEPGGASARRRRPVGLTGIQSSEEVRIHAQAGSRVVAREVVSQSLELVGWFVVEMVARDRIELSTLRFSV